jgi:hypothetical protein
MLFVSASPESNQPATSPNGSGDVRARRRLPVLPEPLETGETEQSIYTFRSYSSSGSRSTGRRCRGAFWSFHHLYYVVAASRRLRLRRSSVRSRLGSSYLTFYGGDGEERMRGGRAEQDETCRRWKGMELSYYVILDRYTERCYIQLLYSLYH